MVFFVAILSTLCVIAFEKSSITEAGTISCDSSSCPPRPVLCRGFPCTDEEESEIMEKRGIVPFLYKIHSHSSPGGRITPNRARRVRGSEFLGKRSIKELCILKRSDGNEMLGKRDESGRCVSEWPYEELRPRRAPYQGNEFLGKRSNERSIPEEYEEGQPERMVYMYNLP